MGDVDPGDGSGLLIEGFERHEPSGETIAGGAQALAAPIGDVESFHADVGSTHNRATEGLAGLIATDLGSAPAATRDQAREIVQGVTVAAGAMSTYGQAITTYNDRVSGWNSSIAALATAAEQRQRKVELAAAYRSAVEALETAAATAKDRLEDPLAPHHIPALYAAGALPLQTPSIFANLDVRLTDADHRQALLAAVDNGTVPDLLTLPPGTVQDWLEQHPEVAVHLDLFDTDAPPADASPDDVGRWWASLGVLEQLAAATRRPADVGGVDGVAAWARDLANRTMLDQTREDLAQEWTETGDDGLQARLGEMRRIQETLDRGGRQLLLLDHTTGERMHAVIAVGNVDTADHVAVFTPGFTTTVDARTSAYDSDMERLRSRTEKELFDAGSSDTVATITWIGYDAPQWHEALDIGILGGRADSVVSDDLAREGGDALASFLRGINASRASDPHLTALGHSYGSTTTGFALQHDDTGVDDAVVFGSPGLGTSERDDLHVDGLHRIEARRDPVADLARFGLDPTWMPDVEGLSAQEAEIDGRTYSESTGHSAYLDDGSTSQHNMAVTIAGLDDRRVGDDGRGAGDILTWWPEFLR
jgi:hypothetical protein